MYVKVCSGPNCCGALSHTPYSAVSGCGPAKNVKSGTTAISYSEYSLVDYNYQADFGTVICDNVVQIMRCRSARREFSIADGSSSLQSGTTRSTRRRNGAIVLDRIVRREGYTMHDYTLQHESVHLIKVIYSIAAIADLLPHPPGTFARKLCEHVSRVRRLVRVDLRL